jgi:peptidoglycan/xylan/chitin deacetylase (PgdA/CDA1 family)
VNRTEFVAGVLDRFPFLAPRRWNGLLSLNYHRIGDSAGSRLDRDTWSATAEDFDRQVRFLKAHCDVVHPADVPALQRRGRGRHLLITFDDGSRDGHDIALPVLRSHGVPALFFITTGFLDERLVAWWDEIAWMVWQSTNTTLPPSRWTRGVVHLAQDRSGTVQRLLRAYKDLPTVESSEFLSWLGRVTGSGRCPADETSAHWMTWDMVRALRAAGMAVGGHTVSHPILTRMERAGQEIEIAGCARRLREELGEPMRWFAYPVGGPRAFDHDSRDLLATAGVELAFSDYGGVQRYDDWDPFDVRRIAVEIYMNGNAFRSMVRWPMLVAPPRPQGWPRRVRETVRGWTGV